MRRKSATLTMALAVALGVGGAATADDRTQRQRDSDRDSSYYGSDRYRDDGIYGVDRYRDERTYDTRARYRDERIDERDAEVDRGWFGRDRQILRGTVIDLERLSTGYGDPQSMVLRVRTEEGRQQLVQLGRPGAFGWGVTRDLPQLRVGERVRIRGEWTRVDGRTYLQSTEIRGTDEGFFTPQFLRGDEVTIDGTLEGLVLVALTGTWTSSPDAAVIRISSRDGRSYDVLVGSANALRRADVIYRPGSRFQVEGYFRSTREGPTTFLVQDIRTRRDEQRRDQRDEAWGIERDRARERDWRDDSSRREDTLGIERERRYGERPSSATAGESVRLRGEVTGLQQLRTDTALNDQTLARLTLDDGRSYTIDLGRDVDLRDLDIRRGDQVVIEGEMDRSQGRDVICVERIAIDGRWRTVGAASDRRNR